MSTNAREITVLEEDGRQDESILVHATCCDKLDIKDGQVLPRRHVLEF